MSPTSYQAALPRVVYPINITYFNLIASILIKFLFDFSAIATTSAELQSRGMFETITEQQFQKFI